MSDPVDEQLRRALEVASATNPDARNTFAVSVTGGNMIMLLRPPRAYETMPKREALMLAAWLVSLSSDDELWAQCLQHVQDT